MRFNVLFVSLFLLFSSVASAMADTTASQPRIAVIAPLYLDSAFSGTYYRLPKTSIPKFFLPGLEFCNGVMMAIDSLKKEKADVEVWIFDSEKKGQSFESLTAQLKSLNLSLVIASLNSSNEQKAIADFSLQNSIPVISSTFPNNNYLTGNPFFAMVNPTWKTHLDAISKYVNQTGTGKNIVLITKSGIVEDKILKQLSDARKQKSFPEFTMINAPDNISDSDIVTHLDSTKQNIIVCGSLSESFGKNLIKMLNDLGSDYAIEAVGMPTWNGLSGTMGKASQNISLTITTPFNYNRSNERIAALSKNYKAKYNANPGDMVFKGYESMYHFTKLLIDNPSDFINNISGNRYSVTNSFNFQPVKINDSTSVPDYLENKKLYLIKIVKGQLQAIE